MKEFIEKFKVIAEIIKKIAASDYPKAVEEIMTFATNMIGCERSSLFLLSKKKRFLITYIHTKSDELTEIYLPSHLGIVGKSIKTGRIQICNDAYSDPDFYPKVDEITGYKTKNILCVPLINNQGEILGAIELINSYRGEFTEEDAFFLDIISQIAGILIQQILKLEKYKEIEKKLKEDKEKLKVILKDLEKKVCMYETYGSIIRNSFKMKRLLELCFKIAKTDLPIFIYGESGSGKELLAKEIHNNSLRKLRNFVSINCAAFPDTLLESEFFGYKKGAFTGAYTDKIGVFEEANNGTLFLDEIGEMSYSLQGKLLRVLETGEFRMLGDTKTKKANVRLISASNKELIQLISEGKFREDLFYRICGVRLDIPPLRERKEDLPILVEYFINSFAEQLNKPAPKVSPKVMQIFYEYNWPGNIRELKNEIYKLVVLAEEKIVPDLLSTHILNYSNTLKKPNFIGEGIPPLNELEKIAIEKALWEAKGCKLTASKILGISRKTLYNKLKHYKIPLNDKTSLLKK